MTLSTQNLSWKYGSGQVALSQISWSLEKGQSVALLGPNGSGKSTLLKILAGILPIPKDGSMGTVRIGDKLLRDLAPSERAQEIAYVPAEIRAEFPIRAFEAVQMGLLCRAPTNGSVYGGDSEDRVRHAMERCQCWELRERELHTLSGGERQMVMLARALAQGARILLLDESLSRMDLNYQSLMIRMLGKLCKDQGYSVVLVAHDVNLSASFAESCWILKDGREQGSGKISDVLSPALLAKLYPGAPIRMNQDPETGKLRISI